MIANYTLSMDALNFYWQSGQLLFSKVTIYELDDHRHLIHQDK